MNLKFFSIIIMLSLVGLFQACSGGHETELAEDNRSPIPVEVAQPALASARAGVETSGTIQSANSVNISARIPGYLLGLRVKAGDKVSKGQLIASVSNDELKAKQSQVNAVIKEAESGLESIRKDYERIERLHKKGSATSKEMDDITSAYEMAQQRVEQARQGLQEVNANIQYASLRAPISGVVTAKHMNAGDLAMPGQPILTIESPGALQAVINIPESQITRVKVGDPVTLRLKANGTTINGKLNELNPSAQATGGQYVGKVDIPAGNKEKVYSGMFVNAFIQTGATASVEEVSSQAIRVPKSALHKQGQLTGLFVVTGENQAVLRWVRTGKDLGDEVEVLAGLGEGEAYVVKAEGKLINGAPVTIQ